MLNERPLLSLLDSEVQTLKISDPVNFFAQYGRGGQGFLSPRPLTLNKCVVDIFAITVYSVMSAKARSWHPALTQQPGNRGWNDGAQMKNRRYIEFHDSNH